MDFSVHYPTVRYFFFQIFIVFSFIIDPIVVDKEAYHKCLDNSRMSSLNIVSILLYLITYDSK